ncbi:MAG TPA: hypothetical protein DD490_20885 [Acidobacteria bacterium]|nr:hypothetical protein [Acidobacteriota bacterium]
MRSRLGILAALLLIALPAFAADRTIQSGIDLWTTPGDGRTFIDFSRSPIPAGFFCFKSAPFAERIVFRGVPVATGEKGVLGATDTIVQRFDDAAFDKKGVARTRIQIRALHFESVGVIETACGAFKAEVRLNGEQPVTRMRIVRENANGGRFFAPIAVNGKVVFTRADGATGEILEITRNVRFPANQGIGWANPVGRSELVLQTSGFVLVDTDNDLLPDTYLPGTTRNFAAGLSSRPERGGRGPETKLLPYCHLVDDEGHCPTTTYLEP